MHLNISSVHLFILVPLCVHRLDHVEPESEEPTDPTPAEGTNPELTEGKPRCIPLIIFDFVLITTLYQVCLCIKFVEVD
jgi:hypothetical protein